MAFSRVASLFGLSCTAVLLLADSACAEPQGDGPYIAYVAVKRAAIRSGPGEDFYATGNLPRGGAVEVYRCDEQGWCAVRPPEGSFSLAPADVVAAVTQRVGKVVTGGVAARVGSRLTDQANVVQVKLDSGERVELLALPRPGDAMVRIAPPAGEFRFIAHGDLSRSPPVEESLTTESPAANAGTRWRSYGSRRQSAPEPIVVPQDALVDGDAARPLLGVAAAGEVAPVPTQLADPIQIVPGSPAAVQPSRYEVDNSDAAPAARPAAPTAPPLASAESPTAGTPRPAPSATPRSATSAATTGRLPRVRFDGLHVESSIPASRTIAELQLDLSRAIVAPPQPWLLAGLREETTTAMGRAETETERKQLRELLARIVLLEEIANERARLAAQHVKPQTDSQPPGALAVNAARETLAATLPSEPLDVFDAQAAAAARDDGASPTPTDDLRNLVRRDLGITPPGSDDDAAITPTPGEPASQFAGTEARYDAVGTLKPVVSRRSQAPQYALVDDQGQIAALLTPSPDLNLQGLVGQRVGVVGSRGYMPEFRRAHVTATRITPLGDGETLRR